MAVPPSRSQSLTAAHAPLAILDASSFPIADGSTLDWLSACLAISPLPFHLSISFSPLSSSPASLSSPCHSLMPMAVISGSSSSRTWIERGFERGWKAWRTWKGDHPVHSSNSSLHSSDHSPPSKLALEAVRKSPLPPNLQARSSDHVKLAGIRIFRISTPSQYVLVVVPPVTPIPLVPPFPTVTTSSSVPASNSSTPPAPQNKLYLVDLSDAKHCADWISKLQSVGAQIHILQGRPVSSSSPSSSSLSAPPPTTPQSSLTFFLSSIDISSVISICISSSSGASPELIEAAASPTPKKQIKKSSNRRSKSTTSAFVPIGSPVQESVLPKLVKDKTCKDKCKSSKDKVTKDKSIMAQYSAPKDTQTSKPSTSISGIPRPVNGAKTSAVKSPPGAPPVSKAPSVSPEAGLSADISAVSPTLNTTRPESPCSNTSPSINNFTKSATMSSSENPFSLNSSFTTLNELASTDFKSSTIPDGTKWWWEEWRRSADDKRVDKERARDQKRGEKEREKREKERFREEKKKRKDDLRRRGIYEGFEDSESLTNPSRSDRKGLGLGSKKSLSSNATGSSDSRVSIGNGSIASPLSARTSNFITEGSGLFGSASMSPLPMASPNDLLKPMPAFLKRHASSLSPTELGLSSPMSILESYFPSLGGVAGLGRTNSIVSSRASSIRRRVVKCDDLAERSSTRTSFATLGNTTAAVDLTILPPIPHLLNLLLAEIETQITTEGLYRLSGSSAQTLLVRQFLEAGKGLDKWNGDVHVLASIVKTWIRDGYFVDGGESLCTFELYEGFIHASKIEDYRVRMISLQDLVHSLPPLHFAILRRVCQHLSLISTYTSTNRMSTTNLSLIFGPTMLRPSARLDSYSKMMVDMSHTCSVVEVLVDEAEWVFGPIEFEEDAEAEVSDAESFGGSLSGWVTNVNWDKRRRREFGFGVGVEGRGESEDGDGDSRSRISDTREADRRSSTGGGPRDSSVLASSFEDAGLAPRRFSESVQVN